ncbi:MAG: AMP-binding protein [Burkholderiaceae bacterium]
MNLSRIVLRHAQCEPDAVALHWEGQDIRYPQFWERICRTTDDLQSQGVTVGDRVAWLGLNDPAMLVLLFALARIGAILLPLNHRLAVAELTDILLHAEACLLVHDAHHAQSAQALADGKPWRSMGSASLGTAGSDANTSATQSGLSGTDASPVLLVYTSGTSGKPKGALYTQAALIWNCVNATHAQDLRASDHALTVLPMFHVGGLCIQTLPVLHAGGCVTLHPRFDAARWLSAVQTRRPSLTVMVPATLRAVCEHPDWAGTDLSALRLVVAGSSVVPRTLIDTFHARGIPVGQVYGATETGPVSIYLRRDDAMRVPGAAGRAGLHVAVRLVDALGFDVQPGAVGEIWIRAPNLMQGYWREPDNPSYAEGWFRSGDLARQDQEGFYWVVGRARDLIISGGENIYPAEIENLLVADPRIAEATVIGQPDARWGEVAVAIVVRRPGTTVDADAVTALLDGRIARFKMPRKVLFRDELPKTALGKVQKSRLLEWMARL